MLSLYELSTYEDCVQRQGGSRKQARDVCLPELITLNDHSKENYNDGRKVRLNRQCVTVGVVHASLAATDAPVEGDRLKVSTLPLPEASCELRELHQIFLDDVDRDGRPELVIGGTATREEVEHRNGESIVTERRRYLWVVDVGEHLTLQLQLSLALDTPARDSTYWVDLNRDERPDLVQIAECTAQDPFGSEDSLCDRAFLPRIWHLYDRQLDRWVNDSVEEHP